MRWAEHLRDRDLAFDIYGQCKLPCGFLIDVCASCGGEWVNPCGVVVVEVQLLTIRYFDVLIRPGGNWKNPEFKSFVVNLLQ